MPLYPDNIRPEPEGFIVQLDRLEQIYEAIDLAYNSVANNYGFHCSGCEDNCCLTHFYHHTYLEFLYLMKGYRALGRRRQIDIRQKAESVCAAFRGVERKINGQSPRLMCPLNIKGLCCLYQHRPMICRMHGLPHELHRPNGGIVQGTGCVSFELNYGKKDAVLFDRTSFYHDVAQLERELRQLVGADTKLKMTVAEMILAF